VQRISLAYNQPFDFDTYIQWQERRILLKAAFPVDILAPTATEIQWKRPTSHPPQHQLIKRVLRPARRVDLSEGDHMVSLLNDCKYGHDVVTNAHQPLTQPYHAGP
jgi:alpha-mannosidase